jgi:hypothetical protein
VWRKFSSHTIRSHHFALRQHLCCLRDELRLPLDRLELSQFSGNAIGCLNWLGQSRRCSAATRNNRLYFFCG